ncbi:type III secretion system inner rod subunit SctI [Acanthopleuribacter pedis]|uniref:Type III secretion system inner rod subunit SctI n=1 Tax=Acanthopleuribacter pedis TaxID=442870 RepID=A0A8J7QBL5_9BACT|nr:type III secretion system inner rod subunit SctI [Acanthopleuribacter pedis]MBO1322591.1 type III secretion system inner rod subunit SctI [Acanthopleuribacter pedis]
MLEPASQQGVQQVVQQQLEQGTQQQQQFDEPDQADVTRFEELLKAQNDGVVDGNTGVEKAEIHAGEIQAVSVKENAVEAAVPSMEVEEGASLGDVILKGMEKISATHEGHVNNLSHLLEVGKNEPINFQDGVKLQMEIMQMNLQQDITTKVADKASQGVQTLFRNQ